MKSRLLLLSILARSVCGLSVSMCGLSEEFSELKFDSSMFDISALMHPRGLHNLVLFGSRQGRLQLWNVNTSKLLYTFTGWDSPVTVLEQVCIVVVVVVVVVVVAAVAAAAAAFNAC